MLPHVNVVYCIPIFQRILLVVVGPDVGHRKWNIMVLSSSLINGGLQSDGDSDSSSRGGSADWASVREYAAAALLQLANQNIRFKGQALQAGAMEPLVALQEHGTQRAKDKATALLNILRDDQQNGQGEALYTRASYQRRVPRSGDGHSSGDYSASQRPDSAQF